MFPRVLIFSETNSIHPDFVVDKKITLQGINISHLGKRKIIFKMPFLEDMSVPWRVTLNKK